MRKARSGSGSNSNPFSRAALIISDVEIEKVGTRISSNSCADIITTNVLVVAPVCVAMPILRCRSNTGQMAAISYESIIDYFTKFVKSF